MAALLAQATNTRIPTRRVKDNVPLPNTDRNDDSKGIMETINNNPVNGRRNILIVSTAAKGINASNVTRLEPPVDAVR